MRKGFTLIELLVVVLIIGILSAVALPKYQLAVERARLVSGFPMLRAIQEARQRYILANGESTNDLDNLDIAISYSKKTDKGQYMSYNGIKNFQKCAVDIYSPTIVVMNFSHEYTIDYYGPLNKDGVQGYCYSWQPNTLGEKICKTLGRKAGTSVENTNSYEIQF